MRAQGASRPDRRRSAAEARGHAAGAVQPPLPGGDRRARQQRPAAAGEAGDRADPHGPARARDPVGANVDMADEEKNETTEEAVEEAAQPPVRDSGPVEPETRTTPVAEEPGPRSKPRLARRARGRGRDARRARGRGRDARRAGGRGRDTRRAGGRGGDVRGACVGGAACRGGGARRGARRACSRGRRACRGACRRRSRSGRASSRGRGARRAARQEEAEAPPALRAPPAPEAGACLGGPQAALAPAEAGARARQRGRSAAASSSRARWTRRSSSAWRR